MNTDKSEDDLFITKNDDEEVKEIVGEADQMIAEADNEEKVDIEIVIVIVIIIEKVNEPIDDISSVAFAESDNKEE